MMAAGDGGIVLGVTTSSSSASHRALTAIFRKLVTKREAKIWGSCRPTLVKTKEMLN
jgi:hypothetical protein